MRVDRRMLMIRSKQEPQMAKAKKKTPKVTDVTDIPMSELVGDDLRDPNHPLNRTKGMTKAQIDAERDRLIARDKQRSTAQHRILTGGGDASRATLTDADKKAIAELQSGEAHRKEIATANRIAKLKAKKAGATDAMPLTGKAALSAIAQSVTKEFVANGGTITKCDSNEKQESKMSKTAKTAKPKANKAQKSAARSERLEKLIAAMKKNGGVTNESMVKLIGSRMSAATIRLACETRGLKFKVVKKDGEPAHYVVNGK
jgi:hypothetical protein